MKRALAFASAAFAFALAACHGDDTPATPDAGVDAGPAWTTVVQGLDGSLLSIWGTSPTNVYAVGGPLGNAGFDTLVVHFDGTAWHRLAAGGTETFWWVSGTGPNDLWMVGEQGRIAHYDGTSFAEQPRTTTATLYGVWPASTNDVWVVGGTPSGAAGAPNDVVLHYDGASWTKVDLPEVKNVTLFKVWGASPDDLYVVGEAGVVWHRTGGAWTLESSPPIAKGTLFTVNGCGPNEVYAVGGRDVLASDGKTWRRLDVTLTNDVNGVSCARPGEVAIVGYGGSKQRLSGGTWQNDFGTEPFIDLHATWADPSGAYWAVGGDFVPRAAPNVRRNGVVARFGTGTVSGVLAP